MVENEEVRGEFLACRLQNLRKAVRAEGGGGAASAGPLSIGRAFARELRKKVSGEEGEKKRVRKKRRVASLLLNIKSKDTFRNKGIRKRLQEASAS